MYRAGSLEMLPRSTPIDPDDLTTCHPRERFAAFWQPGFVGQTSFNPSCAALHWHPIVGPQFELPRHPPAKQTSVLKGEEFW
jgi:hypothetical protein